MLNKLYYKNNEFNTDNYANQFVFKFETNNTLFYYYDILSKTNILFPDKELYIPIDCIYKNIISNNFALILPIYNIQFYMDYSLSVVNSSSSSLYFTNLNPGKYIFEINCYLDQIYLRRINDINYINKYENNKAIQFLFDKYNKKKYPNFMNTLETDDFIVLDDENVISKLINTDKSYINSYNIYSILNIQMYELFSNFI